MPFSPKRVVVTGGAGFLGSHVCERLLGEGADVICVDNLLTGRRENVSHLLEHAGFSFVEADVGRGLEIDGPLDAVLHLASPASPPDYIRHPIETLDVGSAGTRNALERASATGARFLLASTSEVYGDPLVNPQPETYWGNVNPVGPRSVYDEAKRFAEALSMAYARSRGVEVRIARIFNTIGEAMRPDDGRAVPNFASQALRGDPLTVHGDGSQTRSICYVSDLVEGLFRLLVSDASGPVNLGNPHEVTVLELAHAVARAAGIEPEIRFVDRPVDDPGNRRPDITRARELLDWEPRVPLEEALERTLAWFRQALAAST